MHVESYPKQNTTIGTCLLIICMHTYNKIEAKHGSKNQENQGRDNVKLRSNLPHRPRPIIKFVKHPMWDYSQHAPLSQGVTTFIVQQRHPM